MVKNGFKEIGRQYGERIKQLTKVEITKENFIVQFAEAVELDKLITQLHYDGYKEGYPCYFILPNHYTVPNKNLDIKSLEEYLSELREYYRELKGTIYNYDRQIEKVTDVTIKTVTIQYNIPYTKAEAYHINEWLDGAYSDSLWMDTHEFWIYDKTLRIISGGRIDETILDQNTAVVRLNHNLRKGTYYIGWRGQYGELDKYHLVPFELK